MFIDFHALQTLAPSNVNRGEDGAPKTAYFGGVRRQRISSQALKAAQRRDFAEILDSSQLGVRTKRVVELLANRIVFLDSGVTFDEAAKWVIQTLSAAKIKVVKPKAKKGEEEKLEEVGALIFLSPQQVDKIATGILTSASKKMTPKELKPLINGDNAIDLALFGRMVAMEGGASDYNVDASAQVAHAIGVHEATPDFDFYTAVDDLNKRDEETGAGMMGTVEMMSSTVYRYATVNVDQLHKNLGSTDAVVKALEAFAKTFVESLPSGKQNTFASHTLPELVSVAVRDRRPVSYVNAFEEPVAPAQGSRKVEAVRKLAVEAQSIAEMYGKAPEGAWVVTRSDLADVAGPLGDTVALDVLLSNLREAVVKQFGEDERAE